jgi:hypothetical protein
MRRSSRASDRQSSNDSGDAAGDKPQLLEEKLKTFLPPSERKHIGAQHAGAAA